MSNTWIAQDTNTNAAGSWTDKQREHNARNLYKFFKRKGWSIAALAAMTGNMQFESYLNPGQWETGKEPETDGGFGLVQWTPYTNFADWAGPTWRYNYDLQMQRIQYELDNGLQWQSTSDYPISFYQFSRARRSDYSIEWLTRAFEYCYERGTWNNQRVVYAERWYKFYHHLWLIDFLIVIDEKKKNKGGDINI